MSSAHASNRKAKFTVCGSNTKFTVETWNAQADPNTTSLHQRLLHSFDADERQSVTGNLKVDLLWPFDDEECDVQRALYDLNDFSNAKSSSHVIHLHTYCESPVYYHFLAHQQRQGSDVTLTKEQNGAGGEHPATTTPLDGPGKGSAHTNGKSKTTDTSNMAVMLSAKFESDESRLQLQGPHWNSTKWLVSLDSIMNGLVRYFVRKTKKRLGQSNFDDFQYEITLHPVIQLGGEQERYARFDENGSTQIEQLLDLFPNTAERPDIPITLRLSTNGVVHGGDAKRKLRTAFRPRQRHYRIGKLTANEAVVLKKHDMDQSSLSIATSTGKEDEFLKCPPIEHALLGCFSDQQSFEMCLVPIWKANGERLAYVRYGTKLDTIPTGARIDGVYGLPILSARDAESYLRDSRNEANVITLEATDLLQPCYTFNSASVSMTHPVPTVWPQRTTFFVGPFKTYLSGSSSVIGGFRIVNGEWDWLTEIEKSLDDQLKRTARGAEFITATSKKKWRHYLWVLPQSNGNTNMVKYEGGVLANYLDAERLQEENELYVEAHLVEA